MAFKSPAYLQNLVGMEAQNQSTDYLRYQDEIAKQKAELEAQRKKEGSFGNRLKRGLTSAIPGAIAGGLSGLVKGGPMGALAGAGIGAGAGIAGGMIGGAAGNSAASLAALGGSAIGSYMGSGTPGPGQGFTSADVANEYGMGNLKPEDLQMLRAQGYI
jgi:hypothetical protein